MTHLQSIARAGDLGPVASDSCADVRDILSHIACPRRRHKPVDRTVASSQNETSRLRCIARLESTSGESAVRTHQSLNLEMLTHLPATTVLARPSDQGSSCHDPIGAILVRRKGTPGDTDRPTALERVQVAVIGRGARGKSGPGALLSWVASVLLSIITPRRSKLLLPGMAAEPCPLIRRWPSLRSRQRQS